jgi:hypothetical protein
MPRPGPPTLAALLLAALPLGACGTSDEDAIRDTVREATTSTDPAACSEPYTRSFLVRAAYGSRARARQVERGCRANIEQLAAASVDVTKVTVAGARARASFATEGGAFATGTFALRRSGDRWRIDRVTAVALNRAVYDRQQARLARLAFRGSESACFTRRLRKLDDATLEAAIVASDPAPLSDPLLVCLVRPALRRAGLSIGRTHCVIVRLRSDARTVVRLALRDTPAASTALRRRFRRAGLACR